MKTIVRFCLTGCLVLASFGYATAQSAASSSRETTTIQNNNPSPAVPMDSVDEYVRPNRGIPTPPLVEKLLQEGKVGEAITEFNKFKANQQKAKANQFQLLYCEMAFYWRLQWDDPANSQQYAKKADAIQQHLIQDYPNIADTYLLQIEPNTPDDQVVELATKALELDPEYTDAYMERSRALFNLGKTKEACQDFKKLPAQEQKMSPLSWQCKDVKE